ncbi:gfo/Idh/MocA family oxidoreductase [bacterium]|nr:MAG: gfo/Idh/MocA family oxidoreductase [bacterium]
MLPVAIVGCGKIADQHIAAIHRIPKTKIVGVCDREAMMAEQLAERFGIDFYTDDLSQLLEQVKPAIIHITTPPQSHFALAMQCLEAGCHVYVEKPFTINTDEAVRLTCFAENRGLKLTAGHNLQYTLENMKARELVRAGFLGGPPVHIESYYTYNLGDASYAKALLGDRNHWVRCLPGKLLHNIISHGIARIAEFMDAENPEITAFGHASPLLQEINEDDIIDELRVHISDGRNMTASFVFSSQIGPPLNGCRIYGPKNSLIIDNAHRTLIRLKNRHYKSYLNYFVPPFESASEYMLNSGRNIYRFIRSQFHDDSGLKNFIEAFYMAVQGEGPLPLSYREILMTSRIMDSIFQQIQKEAE